MSDQEQWTPGVLPSDAKIGTDDPAEEEAQIEGQLVLDEEEGDVSEDAAG
jgi:hypothetical protein